MKANRNITSILFIAFAALVLVSCQNDSKGSSARTYEICNVDFASWKDLVKVKESVVLKTNIPLSFPEKCLVATDRIVFWDSSAKTVYLFNADGTFISQVGERGHAKNEYTQIRDIAFSPDSTTIKILDDHGIHNYSMEDGHFLGLERIKSDLSSSVWKFQPISENHYLFFCDEGENTIIEYEIVDGRGKVTGLRKRECFPYIKDCFYEYNGEYRVVSDFGSFYVDDFCNNALTQKYAFDFGNNALPNKKKPQNYKAFERINGTPEYHKCIGSALETDQWIYLSVGGLDLKYYDVFINKTTNNIFAGPTTELLYLGTCGDDYWAIPYPDTVKEGSCLYDALKDDIKAYPDAPILVKVKIDENDI